MERLEFESLIFSSVISIFMDRLCLDNIEFDFEDIISSKLMEYKIGQDEIIKFRFKKERI